MLLLDQIDGNVPRKLNTVRVLAPGSSNQHESLSGIETRHLLTLLNEVSVVPINMNPYQGLKQSNWRQSSQGSAVPINMNPYQGLKPEINTVAGKRAREFQST